jgi:YD repeat-containing protein
MKKYLTFLSFAALTLSAVFISSCNEDDGGGPAVVPPAKIKMISFDNGSEVESWEFTYDASDRVSSISNIYDGGTPESITYDYSVSGELTIDKAGSITVYALDAQGRVVKEFWNDDKTEWEGYEYDADGILKKVVEHYGGTDHLKYDLTISNKNVTNRIRYEDDGTTVKEDRVFTYTVGDNASGIHQIYAVDSEWKNVAGLFGKQSQKLLDKYLRKITDDPSSTFGATFTYTFDTENRVATQTKNGTGSGGSFSEVWTYSYYEE